MNAASGPENRSPIASGHLLIVAAALLWSTSGLFAKSPAFSDWPTEQGGLAVRGPLLAFWRALFACVILVPLVRRPSWSLRFIPAVLAFAAMNFTFLTALTTTTAANAIWLQYTAPAWVFLFGATVLREPVTSRDRWLLCFSLLGVALILSCEIPRQDRVGVAYGLVSGFCYAGVVLSIRWLRNADAAWVVALNHGVSVLVFLPWLVFYPYWPGGKQFTFLAGFGILQMGLPYWLFARGVRTVPGHEAAGITLLEPVLVPIWVYLAWRHSPGYQPPAWWTLVGGALILTGLVVRYARLPRRPRASTSSR